MTNKLYQIKILESAEQDLKQIYHYISYHDNVNNAQYVFNKIKEAMSSLSLLPYRGTFLTELYELGITTYRQITFKPYRIIYTVDEETKQVFIEVVIDGRRHINPILLKRLFDND